LANELIKTTLIDKEHELKVWQVCDQRWNNIKTRHSNARKLWSDGC